MLSAGWESRMIPAICRRHALEISGFRLAHAEMETALQHWSDAPLNPLRCPAATTGDLDLLWCEFHATGNKDAVLQIIEVPLSRWERIVRFAGMRVWDFDAQVWTDLETGRLVKVVLTFEKSPKTGNQHGEIVHMFCCYDEPVSIAPPPFSLVAPG